MLLSPAQITALYTRLRDYRGDGRTDILFDSRDRGNYSEYSMDAMFEMLCTEDPTGLAAGLLLEVMIDATIHGSKVTLANVLSGEGFLTRAREVLAIKQDLVALTAKPRDAFLALMGELLPRMNPEYAAPSLRELAITLRDACYTRSKGMKLQWLRCDDVGNTMQPLPLRATDTVKKFETLSSFLRFLTHEAMPGAHLACVAHGATVIGLKYPGRVAFLSSLEMNTHTGQPLEARASNYHMAESLDIDTPMERYPDWRKLFAAGQTEIPLNALPSDRLLWLALLVEMMRGPMADASPDTVRLIATLHDALPAPQKRSNVPALLMTPTWELKDYSLEQAFAELELPDWDRSIAAPGLAHVTAEQLMPVGTELCYLSTVAPYQFNPVKKDSFSNSVDKEFRRIHAELRPLSPELVGSKEELDALRWDTLKHNLRIWLAAWGAHDLAQKVLAFLPEFDAAITHRVSELTRLPMATLRPITDNPPYFGLRFFVQSPRHTGYCPMSYFHPKKRATHFYELTPKSPQDICQMMGDADTSRLPGWLQGWHVTEHSRAMHTPAHLMPWYSLNQLTDELAYHDRRNETANRRKSLFTTVVLVHSIDIPTPSQGADNADA